MPANILRFDSETSAYRGFEIHQDHDDLKETHDHKPSEGGPAGDGWLSTVVHLKSGKTRGPFKFTGDAQIAMRKWAEELRTPGFTPENVSGEDIPPRSVVMVTKTKPDQLAQ